MASEVSLFSGGFTVDGLSAVLGYKVLRLRLFFLCLGMDVFRVPNFNSLEFFSFLDGVRRCRVLKVAVLLGLRVMG